MEFYSKIVNGFPLTLFAKIFILDVKLGSEYASVFQSVNFMNWDGFKLFQDGSVSLNLYNHSGFTMLPDAYSKWS